ncbi:unnamed protein product [Ilex paraguariensis]|uniref:Uncharacterized protein n=1 Tax=Ilex paraguariensis TaxID=185542 RepID=A0ABC8TXL1_9AQUA
MQDYTGAPTTGSVICFCRGNGTMVLAFVFVNPMLFSFVRAVVQFSGFFLFQNLLPQQIKNILAGEVSARMVFSSSFLYDTNSPASEVPADELSQLLLANSELKFLRDPLAAVPTYLYQKSKE